MIVVNILRIFLCIIPVIYAHPNQLSCGTSLTAGTRIMGSNAISDSSRSVVITRGSTTLSSGATYQPGETLNVQISSASGVEYIFEAQNANFQSSKCGGKRPSSVSSNTVLTMPSSGTVLVWVGWATGQSTVRISSQFSLLAGPAVPTNAPTPGVPTVSPTPIPTTNTTSPSIVSDSSHRAAAIAVVGSVGLVASAVFLFCVSKVFSYASVFACGASLFAAIALGLSVAWASNNSSSSSSQVDDMVALSSVGFLGVPNSKANVLAWHVILMAGAFQFTQVLSITSWSMFSNRSWAKPVHVLVHSIAVIAAAIALSAAVKSKQLMQSEALISMHSWVGVACLLAFFSNYLFGFWMAALTMFFPSSWFRSKFNLGSVHRQIGLVALGLTTISILTGVSNQFGQSGCGYITSAKSGSEFKQGSTYYQYLPNACKIANGLGIVSIIAAVLTVMAVLQRLREVQAASVLPTSLIIDQGLGAVVKEL